MSRGHSLRWKAIINTAEIGRISHHQGWAQELVISYLVVSHRNIFMQGCKTRTVLPTGPLPRKVNHTGMENRCKTHEEFFLLKNTSILGSLCILTVSDSPPPNCSGLFIQTPGQTPLDTMWLVERQYLKQIGPLGNEVNRQRSVWSVQSVLWNTSSPLGGLSLPLWSEECNPAPDPF